MKLSAQRAYAAVTQAATGVTVLLAIGLNTVMLTLVLLVCSVAKLLAPTEAALNRVRRFLAALAVTWISINNGILSLMRVTDWDIEVPSGLNPGGCYLVISNHQSWADVMILQRSFNRRLPFFRFFVKSSLAWLPVLGAAWMALDIPFMKRYSRQELESRPELRGRDLDNARRACEKFAEIPVAMTNFPEGTRYSRHKRDSQRPLQSNLQSNSQSDLQRDLQSAAQDAGYQHLLRPHIGGIGQVLFALGEPLDALIDVTIVFPGRGDAAPTLWELVSGQVPRVVVRARQIDIPAALRGRNFRTDTDFRHELELWVRQLWLDKDRLIHQLQ